VASMDFKEDAEPVFGQMLHDARLGKTQDASRGVASRLHGYWASHREPYR